MSEEKIYTRYYTLKRIAREKQWGFVQTNEYGKTGKAHLLEMRSEKLVKYVSWDHPQVLKSGIRASYSDKLAYYYCLSFKGFAKLLKLFPDDDHLQKMKILLFHNRIFEGPDKDFIDFRL